MRSTVMASTTQAPTGHGASAPTSTTPWRDLLVDLRHGAPRRVVTDALARFGAEIPAGATVLEVGAGHYDHGRFFGDLRRLDLDPTQHPDYLGDAHHMPIDDAQFDAVIATSVLEHVDNPYQVVEEIFRVLRPGGRVFAWVPFFFGVHGFPEDVSRFTDVGLRRCFELAGFEVERVDAGPYRGLFHNLSNFVQFVLPRRSPSRWKRVANRALFLPLRLLFPLDRQLRLRTLYSGSELVAFKPGPR